MGEHGFQILPLGIGGVGHKEIRINFTIDLPQVPQKCPAEPDTLLRGQQGHQPGLGLSRPGNPGKANHCLLHFTSPFRKLSQPSYISRR